MNQAHQADQLLFSVIIPTYNRGYIISDAIDSIISQNIENAEIVVVDDGSTGNTKVVIDKYEE